MVRLRNLELPCSSVSSTGPLLLTALLPKFLSKQASPFSFCEGSSFCLKSLEMSTSERMSEDREDEALDSGTIFWTNGFFHRGIKLQFQDRRYG